MSLVDKINSHLIELDSPAGFKMVYKSNLIDLVSKHETEAARKYTEMAIELARKAYEAKDTVEFCDQSFDYWLRNYSTSSDSEINLSKS